MTLTISTMSERPEQFIATGDPPLSEMTQEELGTLYHLGSRRVMRLAVAIPELVGCILGATARRGGRSG